MFDRNSISNIFIWIYFAMLNKLGNNFNKMDPGI